VEKNLQWKCVHNLGFHPTLTHAHASEEEAQRRWSRCLYGHVCFTIDQGYLYRCPESSFVPGLVLGEDAHLDGKPISSFDATSFYRFALREDHLHSCHRCFSLEKYAPWTELPKDTSKSDWLDAACAD
jgi:hypothetical protein